MPRTRLNMPDGLDDPLAFQLFNGTLGDITNAAVTVTVVKLA